MGLRIIDVHAGAYDDLGVLTKDVEEKRYPFPVLHDADNVINDLYDIAAYPVAYLIGADGRVIWEGQPQAANAKQMAMLEKLIDGELKKVAKRLKPRRDGGVHWTSGADAAKGGVTSKKRILLYKDWPRRVSCMKFKSRVLFDQDVRDFVNKEFLPVWADHPGVAQNPAEQALWAKTKGFDPGVILWVLEPDGSRVASINYSLVKKPSELLSLLKSHMKPPGSGDKKGP